MMSGSPFCLIIARFPSMCILQKLKRVVIASILELVIETFTSGVF